MFPLSFIKKMFLTFVIIGIIAIGVYLLVNKRIFLGIGIATLITTLPIYIITFFTHREFGD